MIVLAAGQGTRIRELSKYELTDAIVATGQMPASSKIPGRRVEVRDSEVLARLESGRPQVAGALINLSRPGKCLFNSALRREVMHLVPFISVKIRPASRSTSK